MAKATTISDRPDAAPDKPQPPVRVPVVVDEPTKAPQVLPKRQGS
jgi:hypothetical protein